VCAGCPPEVPHTVCGVGINFRSDNTGALFVSSIVPEGQLSTRHTCFSLARYHDILPPQALPSRMVEFWSGILFTKWTDKSVYVIFFTEQTDKPRYLSDPFVVYQKDQFVEL
jgi:hypothetical protein